MNAVLAFHARASLGEAALWHDGRLLWVDIDAGTVNRFDPVRGTNEVWTLGQMVGTVVPRACGGFVVGAHRGVGFFDPLTAQFKIFADPAGGRAELRCNDGKCDPRGRLFAGTIGIHKPRPPGALYRIDPDLGVTCVVEGTGTANGLAWSHDRQTMYFIDTPTRAVSAFDYDESTGRISGRREIVRFGDAERGRPDGMTIDERGFLWVALYEGGAVVCCDPESGAILERIRVPASRTTSCAFGGPDLGELFITSGRDPAEPESGGIFVVRPGVRGVAAFSFAG
jgi:sugar lactone lactonase YvrE